MRTSPGRAALSLAATFLLACGLRQVRRVPPAPVIGDAPMADPPAVVSTPPAIGGCETDLLRAGVPFTQGPPTRGVARPVTLQGPVRGVRLVPRGARPALMDCELLRALADVAPLFRELGIDELRFSAAYDFRVRRGTSRLSTHAAGLALDVHELHGPAGKLDVAKDFEAGVGRWRDLRAGDEIGSCIGAPRTAEGRTLRTLVCRLKLTGPRRTVVTPDDDADHRDHLHIEAPLDVIRARG